jgi:hypothetical protein
MERMSVQLGVGSVVALLIDAASIRAVLLPR